MMKILMLTQYYAPEPHDKVTDLAEQLSTRGYPVQVITGFPCYPRGKIYSGYRQSLYSEEYLNGPLVTRIPQFPDHSRSAVKRMLYYCSFALSLVTLGLWRARSADVIYVYQAALPIGLSAWLISRLKRTPYVVDVVDLWPESVASSGMMKNRLVLRLIYVLAKFIYRGAARIHVITEGYRDNLIAMGVPAKKISVIRSWPPEGMFDPVAADAKFAEETGLSGRFNVVYAGAMGKSQHLETVVEAALLLKDIPKIQFVMIGDGVELPRLQQFADEKGATNVCFWERKPPEEMPKIYALSDALLVHLKPDPMSQISIPAKTLAYLASSRPLLMAVQGEAGELVEKYGCGLPVPPCNPAALAEAVKRLYHGKDVDPLKLSKASRKTYEQHFSSKVQVGKVLDGLSAVTVNRAA